MPEGDTIFRTARTLQRAIGGQTVTRFESVLPKLTRIDYDTPLAGRTVEKVEAQGKWLLIRFSGDLIHVPQSSGCRFDLTLKPVRRPNDGGVPPIAAGAADSLVHRG